MRLTRLARAGLNRPRRGQIGMRMKWIKRLLLTVVVLVILAGAAAVLAYVYGFRGTPEWLRQPVASEAEQAAAANRLDQKLLETLSVVREMDAYDPAAASAGGDDQRPSATQPATNLQVTLTEQELNAAFQKWDRLYGWTERYKEHVQDPSIVLHNGRIVLAGETQEVNSVLSLHFDPKLNQDGELSLRLAQVLAGRLPLPQSFLDKYRASARARLEAALPTLQRRAEFRPDGSANSEAMSAAMAKLFLNVLADEPAEPVLFLPVRNERSVPVRLTDVDIEDKSLTLTVKPLNAAERVSLLQRIRERFDKETALNRPPGKPEPSPDHGS